VAAFAASMYGAAELLRTSKPDPPAGRLVAAPAGAESLVAPAAEGSQNPTRADQACTAATISVTTHRRHA
jgi:hypothetical protein